MMQLYRWFVRKVSGRWKEKTKESARSRNVSVPVYLIIVIFDYWFTHFRPT